MGVASAIHERLSSDSSWKVSANNCHGAVQKKVEDRFELIDAAGLGFFGVVFYALSESDFLAER